MATQTGWSIRKILNMNYQMLVMMSADAPRYVNGEKDNYVSIQSEDELQAAIGQKYAR